MVTPRRRPIASGRSAALVAFAILCHAAVPSRCFLPSSGPSSTTTTTTRAAGRLRRATASADTEADTPSASDTDESVSMRAEIDALRRRARERLEEVSHKADAVLASAPTSSTATGEGAAKALDEEKKILGLSDAVGGGPRERRRREVAAAAIAKENSVIPASGEDGEDQDHPVETTAPTFDARVEKGSIEGGSEDYGGKKIDAGTESVLLHAGDAPLENTCWKIMLNVGREPGTWMPKTWGVSGERLLLQLQVQFRPDCLDEREDFLGGAGTGTPGGSGSEYTGSGGLSSVCHVVHNDAVFGPTLTESARRVRFADGGWRIGRGEGPLGTDVLRFYVELLEEQVERGDVYLPVGRVYCTCGYFDVSHREGGPGRSRKVDAQRKLDAAAEQCRTIGDAMNGEGPFSLKRVGLWQDMARCRAEVDTANRVMMDLRVMEPDLSLLRLSRKRDIGLTREGGVCCKVQKGPAGFYEYHILGRFEAASVEHGSERVE